MGFYQNIAILEKCIKKIEKIAMNWPTRVQSFRDGLYVFKLCGWVGTASHIHTQYKRDCLTRLKLGIAICTSIENSFQGQLSPITNSNFIKGTLYNLQKKIQHQNGSAILDGLHNSRWGSFHFVCVILDDANICMDNHTRISSFFTFWAV